MKSSSLPGVPTTMCAPRSTSRSWWPTDVPPYTTTGRSLLPCANLRASLKICATSSRVGATTRAIGCWTSLNWPHSSASIIPVSTGRRKAAYNTRHVTTLNLTSFILHDNHGSYRSAENYQRDGKINILRFGCFS